MRIVLDTNVLVSGLLNPFGTCGKIVRLLTDPRFILCIDARILAEYKDVLRRPRFQFDPCSIDVLVDYIKDTSAVYNSTPLGTSLPDPDADQFLEVAIAASADCLVTGNLKHYPRKQRNGINVLSPNEFLAIME